MKKNSSLKRSLAMGMAVAMVGATLAGCGGSSSAAASSTAESTAGSEAAAEPANAEKPYEGTTLTWYTKLNANVSDNYTNLGETPWAQYVEEKTGIHIEFQHPTQGSENEEFAVMVASGEYPDIIEHTWTSYSGGGGAAINDGVIIALDDYMDQAPNLSALLEENPEISKMIKSSSGNYYCFPFLRGLETPNKTEFSSGLTYRADVLKELGFDTVPETIDEWEEVLRAAKAAGFSKPFTTRNEWVKDVWSPAFDNWGSFYVDDGVVKNGLIEDSRKEFIARMAAWYDEGLLDNDWMQADKKSTQTDFVAGNCVLGYAPFGQGLGTYTQAMMEADPNFNQAAVDSLNGEGIAVRYVQADIANHDDRLRIVVEAVEAFGRVDVLVNNAGVAPRVRADLLEMTEESFDRVVGINTKGNMFLTQAVAKQMIAQQPLDGRRGVIVNVSSCSSVVSSTSRGEYCVETQSATASE